MKFKKVNLHNIVIFLFFVSSILYDLFGLKSFSYFDEFFGIFSLFFIFYYIIIRKKNEIIDNCGIKKLMIILILFIILAFVNYLTTDIKVDATIFIKEIFLFFKEYIIFTYIIIKSSKKNNKFLINFFVIISKVVLFVLAIFAIVNSIYNIGMSAWDGSFRFFATIGETVASWSLLFLLLIISFNRKNSLIYFLLAFINIIYAKSGTGYCGFTLLLFFHLFYNKKIKFNWYHLLILLPILLLVSKNEIEIYILDSTSPRAKLFNYSIVTANDYFPFGSGVGTYGSPSAVENYSPLYVKYCFYREYGMTVNNPSFLVDNYYPRILAEFGYFGLVLYIILIYIIFTKLILKIENNNIKKTAFLMLVLVLIVSIGFITSGCWGCTTYMLIGLLIKNDSTDKKKFEKEMLYEKKFV